MNNNKVISLAILPVVALSGCDDVPKTKVAPTPPQAVVQRQDTAYQNCDPKLKTPTDDCTSGGGGSGGGGGNTHHAGADNDADGKNTQAKSTKVPYWGDSGSSSRGGFGDSAGRSGG